MVDERSPSEPRGNPAPKDRDTSSSSHELPMEPRAKVEPGSGKHVVHAHFPNHPNCEICLKKNNEGFLQKTCWHSRAQSGIFRDLMTADHKILSEGCESRNNHRYAVVVQDLATQWLQSYPCKTKSSQETEKSLMNFLEPTRKPKVIYTDNSLEFGKSCEELSWNHRTSTHHRFETNGIAEKAVRRVKEGTSAVLLQSGLDKEWWADSMECCCYLRNIQSLLLDGKTPHERRFGMPFNGPVIPFGAMVEYHLFLRKTNLDCIQAYSSVLYAGRIWKGDIVIADNEELEEMDASEIYARRLNAKEVKTQMKGDNFIFPVADGTVNTPP